MTGRLICILLTAALLLQGCSSRSRVQVDERSIGAHTTQTASAPVKKAARGAPERAQGAIPASYRVQRGDTLYSIAWRYGLDYRELAHRNGIGSSYQIYPGQRLSLKSAPPAAKPAAHSSGTSPSRPAKAAAASPPATAPRHAAVTPPAPEKGRSVRSAAQKNETIQWRWPSNGKVIAGFSTKGTVNKGINLAGNLGEPVFAAASGEVVYAGNGLLGYGNLIIIHHNQQYLSAYAHNSRVFVKENDKVLAGDKIAEKGSSGTTNVMLHFEIRREGVPVNPLRYLPTR